ncbi:ATP-binding protein [Lentisphaerota bacterium WC36G]|nr:PAS domain S-box protein [Lentisphaerae bacterium WC36]
MNAKNYFFSITTLIIVLLICLVSIFFWSSSKKVLELYHQRTEQDLCAQGILLKRIINDSVSIEDKEKLQEFCQNMGSSLKVRLTFIDERGAVVADNYSEVSQMQNHAERPEVAQILDDFKTIIDNNKISTSSRYSSTLKQDMFYIAMNCQDKNRKNFVLRLAVSVASIQNFINAVHREILFVAALGLLSAMLVSYLILIWVKMPIKEICAKAKIIANGQLDCKIEVSQSGAVSELANSINHMAEQLKYRLNKSIQQRNEREAILSSMLESIVAIDYNLKVTGVNQAACKFFMVKGNSIIGENIDKMTQDKKLLKLINDGLERPETFSKEISVMRNNVKHYFKVIVSPLKINEKKRTGVLLVLTDISEVKKLENFRSDFIANLSHEIKTPITALLSAIEVLNDGAIEDPVEAARFMEIINRHSQRLNALIEDILSLSMLENETVKESFNLTSAPVGAIIDVAMALCQAKADSKNIKLIKENIDPYFKLNVDPPLLEQAIINLITNAIKYSESGTVVKIIGKLTEKDYRIIVKDSGIGIAEEHLPRLFERFYRVDKARSRSLGGTGLGLAIVKHIVSAHNGSVEVYSEVGKGTEFIIIFPLNEE